MTAHVVETPLEVSESFSAALGRALELKAFPGAASQALVLLSDPLCDAEVVADALASDPALSARLLAAANSAYFGVARPCVDVHVALARLGNRNAGDLVLRVASLGMFQDASGVATLFRDHAVAVAAIARLLAEDRGVPSPESVSAAALLSDIGKLVAQAAGEIDYDAMPADVHEYADRIHVLERASVGWDHATLGGHLLEAWQLPAETARAVAWHHQPERAYAANGALGLTVSLMRLADAIEYQLRKRPDVDADFVAQLGASTDARYADVSCHDLTVLWSKLEQARRTALSQLGHRW